MIVSFHSLEAASLMASSLFHADHSPLTVFFVSVVYMGNRWRVLKVRQSEKGIVEKMGPSSKQSLFLLKIRSVLRTRASIEIQLKEEEMIKPSEQRQSGLTKYWWTWLKQSLTMNNSTTHLKKLCHVDRRAKRQLLIH